ncbi:MAG TPA: hypothetical protein VJC20_02020 [Candidatus Paceibacterota bacterium]
MKARLFDLFAGTMELVRDGNRNGEEVAKVLQTIKDHANFATLLGFAAGILRTVATVSASATKSFCAKDYFVVVVKATENANVRIAWLGDNFRKHFLNKVEKHIDGAILAAHRLEKDLLDREIRTELGSTHEETALSYLWELLTKQPNGESGVLLTNGYANIFYIRSAAGTLWAVYASWNDDGWYVNAYSVEYPLRWNAGGQVFSCDS